MKLLLCVVLFTVGAVVKAQQQDYAFPDYWQNDYDSLYDNFYNDAGEGSNENTEVKQAETSKQVDTEIQDVKEDTEVQNESEGKEFDVMADYQIEDNRSNSGEKEQPEENKEVAAEEQPMPDEALENENNEELAVLPVEEAHESGPVESNVVMGLDDEMWGDLVEDDVAPLPLPSAEDNKDILEETRDILNEDTQNFDDQQAEESDKQENPVEPDEQSDIDRILEETNKLMEEGDDPFEPIDYDNSDEFQEEEKSDEDLFSENNDEIEEDTPAKVYADLNADLDKLFETLDKLSDSNSDESEGVDEETADDDDPFGDNVEDYEEKYGKPYKEDVALSWRNAEADAAVPNDSNQNEETANENNNHLIEENEGDDYENLDDSNLSDIFAENADANAQDQNKLSENDENEQGLIETEGNNNGTVEENNVSGKKEETNDAPIEKNEEAKEAFDYVDNFDMPLDREPNADDDIDNIIKQIFSDDIKENAQSYGNDALIDEKQPKNEDAVEFESIETNDTNVEEIIEQKSVMVDDLSSAELSDLMTQFAVAHSEDLDVHSENFAKHVAPVHVTLSVDEPTVITSPNYPNPYPTNNIVDWIFEGPGTGIELNITAFAVNGALGDYLLVKPGGIDESGQDGLIFSYRLTSERRYRFADVNRMFVRFEAKPGWQFLTGFSFSVKMIWPLPQFTEEVPEPEAVLHPPHETLTLNLAGLTLTQFGDIKDEFLDLIADMADAYIKDNDIDRGINTTLEVAQITRTTVCNIRWPSYETCVEVTFGVPLHYEEDMEEREPRLTAEDLDTMWTTYIIKEPFAKTLRSLGITEYAIPNDRTVLMVWLVIAAGVLISMAMLAFALWRFSCFEDYTRMQAYNDADSIQNEKRHLDLYPTPHQTLPPLYAENDYKWADDKYDDSTRVDMGGFANKSYVRDELFDLDSDEDVITTRDRKGVISPRNFYDV